MKTIYLVVALVAILAALPDWGGCNGSSVGALALRSGLAIGTVFQRLLQLKESDFSSSTSSPQLDGMQALLIMLKGAKRSNVEEERRQRRMLNFGLPQAIAGTKIKEIEVNERPALLIAAPGVEFSAENGVILHFHPGAYVYYSAREFSGYSSYVSRSVKAPVFSIEYAKGPENKVPIALDDAIKAYEMLLEGQTPLGRVDAKKIVVMGESAGGGLTLSLLQYLKKNNRPLPAGAAMSSPWVDLSCDYPSMKQNANKDAILTKDFICIDSPLRATDLPHDDPRVSPIHGSFAGLPPLLFTVARDEMLRDSVIAAATKAKQAGVRVALEVEPNAVHCYQIFYDWAPEIHDAFGRYTGFARSLIAENREL